MSTRSRVCVVTGGAAGLGRAMADRFAQDGDAVVLVDRDADRLASAVSAIAETGGRADGRAADVSNQHQVEETAEWIQSVHGRVDVLVNNAGVALREGSVADMSRKAWDLTLAVNLTGPFLMSRSLVPLMPPGSVIVNVATNAAHRAVPGSDAYVASKAGVVGLTKAMAVSLADRGIRVNAVSPGVTGTEEVLSRLDDPRVQAMIDRAPPLGEYGRPEELAAVVSFLCSPEARYVNGAVLAVDGGATA
ncbi:MAG: SDR family oxidoreductase [Acidimicrobiaceae bacterium]|nr:SDR family oxidoreductase [Acidimicrobiaceae bacterium]